MLVKGRVSQVSPLTLAHARPRANMESAKVKSVGSLQGECKGTVGIHQEGKRWHQHRIWGEMVELG